MAQRIPRVDKLTWLAIGQRGENAAMDVPVDVSSWYTKWPAAHYTALFRRPAAPGSHEQEETPLEVSTSLEAGILTWHVSANDTAITGLGAVEFRCWDDTGLLKKSRVIPVAVDADLAGYDPETPSAWQSWYDQLVGLKNDAEEAAETAVEASAGLNERMETLYYPALWTPELTGGPTSNGVTYTWAGNQCHVHGQFNGNTASFHAFVNSSGAMPHGFKAGGTYVVKRTPTAFARLEIFPYINGAMSDIIFDSVSTGAFTIPANATGLYMRVRVITRYAVDETFTVYFATVRDGHLTPVDVSGEDETNKFDMTDAIQAKLNEFGYCHLDAGVYYVRGGIDMPIGATLEGEGANTVIRLLASVEDGYAVKMYRDNTVRNIEFNGAYAELLNPATPLGQRDGIRVEGTNWSEGNLISGCRFRNFTGSGVRAYATGGGIETGLRMSDCYAKYCGAGIYLAAGASSQVEYGHFTNVITWRCYYGVINNGGNNTFVNCSFHGAVGFLIDNINGASANSGHGIAVGCVFNHINNWRSSTLGDGNAIELRRSGNGFVFSSCQFWYSKVSAQDSPGVVLSACEFGGNASLPPTITATGSPLLLNGCIFMTTPTLTLPTGSTVIACRDASGRDVAPL